MRPTRVLPRNSPHRRSAQSYLQRFLSSGPAQRRQMALQIQAMPEAAQYVNDLNTVAGSCSNY